MRSIALLVITALLGVAAAAAQGTWSVGTAVSSSGVPVGTSTNVVSIFTAPAAATVTLETQILGPGGAIVDQVQQSGVTFQAGQTISATAVAYAPPATAVNGTYTVAVGVLDGGGNRLYWNAGAASFAVIGGVAPSSAPTAGTWAPPLPPCLPKVQYPVAEVDDVLPAAVSTRYTRFAVWVCQLPGGYITYADLFTPDQTVLQVIWNYIKGAWTLSQAQADCMATCVPPTASENTFLQSLVAKYRPKAVVAFNGSTLVRSVYTTNPDGTLNPTPVAGESIGVASPCDETTRIASAPSYYSVAGQKDQNSRPLQQGRYAVCVVSLPIGAN
jgi:hypothetical protein